MIEDGGQYRSAQARGKRSVCGIREGADKSLCGFPRDELDVGERGWIASRDPDVVAEGYRPCADCCAAYKAVPVSAGRQAVAIKVVAGVRSREVQGRPRGGSPMMSERLPEPMDRYGQTPRDAERLERVRARLGRVVPLLEVDADGRLSGESLWQAGSSVTHAGAVAGSQVRLVCRDAAVGTGSASHPDKGGLTCSACRGVLYMGGKVSVRMFAVIRRAHDADRFRPVGGVGENSHDPLTRPVHEGLVRDESGRASAVMTGAAGSDMPRTSGALRKTETAKREFALRGWASEAMGAVVRNPDGSLWCPGGAGCAHGRTGYHSGWDYANATGRIPEGVYARMSHQEKDAVRRGMKHARRVQRQERDRLTDLTRRGTAARAVVGYRHADRHGDARSAPQRSAAISTYVPEFGNIDAKPTIGKVAGVWQALRGER